MKKTLILIAALAWLLTIRAATTANTLATNTTVNTVTNTVTVTNTIPTVDAAVADAMAAAAATADAAANAAMADAAATNAANAASAAAIAGTKHPSTAKTLPPKWQSSLTLGLTLTRGNSDSVLVTGQLASQKKTPFNEYNLGADGAYGEQSGVKNAETLHGFAQWNHLFTPRWFSYVRGDALHDGIAGLDYRFTVSPGVGYYLIKNTNATLALESGPGFVVERLGSVDDTYATFRLGDRFEYKFNDHTRFWETAEILPQVDRWQNYVFNTEFGIESAITKSLSLKTFLQDNYENRPATGFKDNDVRLVSGISYKF